VNTVEYQQVVGRRTASERHHDLPQPDLYAPFSLDAPLPKLATAGPGGIGDQSRSSAANGLRLLLARAHSLSAMLGESHAPSIRSLRATTERVAALATAGEFEELTSALGGLLPGLEAAVRTVPKAVQADAYELTAMAYQACSAALMTLGEPLAAWVAADRAMAAAEQAGNLLLAAAGQYRLASVFLDSGEFALADEIARTSLIALRGLAELGDPDALSLRGGLTLLRAAVAARTGHPATAFAHVATARLIASRLAGRPANELPEFGAQYVALVEIAVSVDLGDAGHALRAAAAVDTACMSPGRLARMLVDVARAYALRQEVDEATTALARAMDLDPGQTRDRAFELIRELTSMRTPPPRPLLALAERVGALPR
jgi:tetratricopeptide (TPR) repeat protein